jgi:hypothetical protein
MAGHEQQMCYLLAAFRGARCIFNFKKFIVGGRRKPNIHLNGTNLSCRGSFSEQTESNDCRNQ